MAGKMSAAMRGLSNFLRQEARMTNNEATQTLESLRSVSGWNDDGVAEAFTRHLRGKFKAAAAGETHNDLPEFENFLRANNNTLGGDIWNRGQRAGEFSREWDKRNFAQYKDLDTYTTHYNNALTKAVRGKTIVDYDAIGRKMQRQRAAIKNNNFKTEQLEALTEELNAAKSGYEDSTLPDKIKLDNANKAYVDSLNEEINVANVQDNIYTAKSNNLSHKQQASKEISQQLLLNQSGDTGRYAQRVAGEDAITRDAVNDTLLNELSPMEIEQARQAGYDLKTPGSIRDAIDYTRGYKQKMADNATGAGQVSKTFLNARSSEEARQAAIDNVRTRIDANQEILNEYEQYMKNKGVVDMSSIDEAYQTLDDVAKLTDEQIAQSGNDAELKKVQRAFAQDPTSVQALTDYVEGMKKLGRNEEVESTFGAAYAARTRQKTAETQLNKLGSGKTLQETAAGSAQEAAVADAAADFTGVLPTYEQAMTGNGKISLDRAMLRERMGGDPTDWGYDAAAGHLAKNQEDTLNKTLDRIRNSKASDVEKRKMFDDAIAAVQKNVTEGPGMSDFFFGNQLHTGAVGAAAIMGTMGVAFGGRKSNAELYSSPF